MQMRLRQAQPDSALQQSKKCEFREQCGSCSGIDVQRLNSATCTVIKTCGSHRRNYSACTVLHRKRLIQLFSSQAVIRSMQSRRTVNKVNVTARNETLLCGGTAGRAERSRPP